MHNDHRTIPSGIPPLDARVGGAMFGRLNVLSGGPGTGKTTACLQFAGEGLRRGESVAMLTSDRLSDLRSHAAWLGADLVTPLREGRLTLLRYRRQFAALLQHAVSPEQMLDDLRRLCLAAHPTRIVVDTVAPFLTSALHSDTTLDALAALFEEAEATTLFTYTGDLSSGRGVGYDYRLEPLVERAAGIFHLTRRIAAADVGHDPHAPTREFQVLRVRQPVLSGEPASFDIEAGRGITLVEPRPVRRVSSGQSGAPA